MTPEAPWNNQIGRGRRSSRGPTRRLPRSGGSAGRSKPPGRRESVACVLESMAALRRSCRRSSKPEATGRTSAAGDCPPDKAHVRNCRGSYFSTRMPIPTEGHDLKTLFLFAKSSGTGVSVSIQARSGGKWRPDEIAFLRFRYASTPGMEIAAALGRSLSAVQLKAMRLGLKRDNGHASTPAMREAGRRRRGRPFTDEHRAALRAARRRQLSNKVQIT
jgi:hypothetical protein